MISLHKLNDTAIQTLGNHNGISINGMAYKVKINGNQSKVWQYDLKLLKGPKLVIVKSNKSEGTLTNEDSLLSRIIEACENFD